MLPTVIKLRKEEAGIAILLGDMGNVIKATVPHGEWLPTARRHFPEVEIRALQDYMRIASIRKVENHTSLGIYKLIKLAAEASRDVFKADDDPIQTILNGASEKLETTTEEPNTLAAIAIASSRLSKAGLTIEIADASGLRESRLPADRQGLSRKCWPWWKTGPEPHGLPPRR